MTSIWFTYAYYFHLTIKCLTFIYFQIPVETEFVINSNMSASAIYILDVKGKVSFLQTFDLWSLLLAVVYVFTALSLSQ